MSTAVHLDVAAAARQELSIAARGPDVACIPVDRPIDLDTDVPDPVASFAAAASLGVLGGAEGAGATVLESRIDDAARAASWRLAVDGLDPGALRVLVNMLLGRALDLVEVTSPGAGAAARVDLSRAPYPAPVAPLPFLVEREPPMRRSRERFVQIAFTSSPSPALLAEVYAALEAWAEVLLLGGYPRPGLAPRASGAIADLPFLLDDRTVEIAFPEVFACDEACFSGVFAYASRLHHRGALVERVCMR